METLNWVKPAFQIRLYSEFKWGGKNMMRRLDSVQSYVLTYSIISFESYAYDIDLEWRFVPRKKKLFMSNT